MSDLDDLEDIAATVRPPKGRRDKRAKNGPNFFKFLDRRSVPKWRSQLRGLAANKARRGNAP